MADPDGNVELIGQEEIRAGIARLRGLWVYFAASRVIGIWVGLFPAGAC